MLHSPDHDRQLQSGWWINWRENRMPRKLWFCPVGSLVRARGQNSGRLSVDRRICGLTSFPPPPPFCAFADAAAKASAYTTVSFISAVFSSQNKKKNDYGKVVKGRKLYMSLYWRSTQCCGHCQNEPILNEAEWERCVNIFSRHHRSKKRFAGTQRAPACRSPVFGEWSAAGHAFADRFSCERNRGSVNGISSGLERTVP